MFGCNCCCHKRSVTITIDTSVNGGPLTKAFPFTVSEGDHLTIRQPVEVFFSPDGPPTAHLKKKPPWPSRPSPTKQS